MSDMDNTDEVEVAKEHHVQCGLVGKNCLASKCCAIAGLQCFKKNDHWASCRRHCTPGRDPIDPDPTSWVCEPLGPRAPGVAPPPDFSIEPAPWVAKKCSANGENCSATRCCKEAGAQCYVKTTGWAACKAECTPGPDPTDADSHPWECKQLGMRTPGPPSKSLGVAQSWVQEKCSEESGGCMDTGCCRAPGQQCFKKHDTWAMCRSTCTPGPLLTDLDAGIWNCTPLGGRTPGIPKLEGNVQLAPWVKTKCSKNGENCEDTQCCAEPTMQCYAKAPGWAMCMNSCEAGVHPEDRAGGAWSCRKLGPRTPRPWGRPSLYCFSVLMLSSYEAGIMRQALWHGGLGIFSCELYDLFSQDGETVLGDGPNGEVRTHHFVPALVTTSVDGTAGNAALFQNVWEKVMWVGAYKFTDWTVKSDPDAVVMPDRLRTHLAGVSGATYIVNCNKPGMSTGPMMFGSVEAITKAGIQKYFDSGDTCHKNYQFGEDRWLTVCFEEIGVAATDDFGMVGDNVCTGGTCGDGHAAFHPYKSAEKWMACWNAAHADAR